MNEGKPPEGGGSPGKRRHSKLHLEISKRAARARSVLHGESPGQDAVDPHFELLAELYAAWEHGHPLGPTDAVPTDARFTRYVIALAHGALRAADGRPAPPAVIGVPTVAELAERYRGMYAEWEAEHRRLNPAPHESFEAWFAATDHTDNFESYERPKPFDNPLESSVPSAETVDLVRREIPLIEARGAAEVERLSRLPRVPSLPRSWDDLEAWCTDERMPPWGAWYSVADAGTITPQDLREIPGNGWHEHHPLYKALMPEWFPMLHFLVCGRTCLEAAELHGVDIRA